MNEIEARPHRRVRQSREESRLGQLLELPLAKHFDERNLCETHGDEFAAESRVDELAVEQLDCAAELAPVGEETRARRKHRRQLTRERMGERGLQRVKTADHYRMR